jgi:CubicO group peptidase (beta-lactamase class C family)
MPKPTPKPDTAQVHGDYSAQWQPVADVFAQNVLERGDDGAACTIYQSGKPVLSLWGGYSDKASDEAWQQDTLVNVFSAAKPILAWAVLDLVARGQLNLDTPVAEYWPEFAGQGKQAISTRMLLGHRAGLPALEQPVADELIYDWQAMIAALEVETPVWEPDTAVGYHVFTFGWLLGEVVTRVSGMPIADFVEQNLRQRHNIDVCFGVADEDLPRVADVEPYLKAGEKQRRALERARLATGARKEPRRPEWQDTTFFKAFHNPPTLGWGTNSLPWRQAVIPGGNGHASGAALARFYGLLVSGEDLLAAGMLHYCRDELSAGKDRVLGLPARFSHGFMLSDPQGLFNLGVDAECFGHAGAGGSLGFADPEQQLGFSYVTRHISKGMMGDRRAHKLITAAYSCLGESRVTG